VNRQQQTIAMEYFFTWNSLIEFGLSFIEFGLSFIEFGLSFIEFGLSFIEFGLSFIEFGMSFIEFGMSFIEFGLSFIEFGQPPIMHNAKSCHATTNKLDIFLIGSSLDRINYTRCFLVPSTLFLQARSLSPQINLILSNYL